jgi:hypothetical protein
LHHRFSCEQLPRRLCYAKIPSAQAGIILRNKRVATSVDVGSTREKWKLRASGKKPNRLNQIRKRIELLRTTTPAGRLMSIPKVGTPVVALSRLGGPHHRYDLAM